MPVHQKNKSTVMNLMINLVLLYYLFQVVTVGTKVIKVPSINPTSEKIFVPHEDNDLN